MLRDYFTLRKKIAIILYKIFQFAFVFQFPFRHATLSKRDSNTGVSVNIVKFLRTSILKNTCKQLLLQIPEPLHTKTVLLYILNKMP